MNPLKSLFISGFVAYLMMVFVFATLQLLRGMEPLLSWLGMALAGLGPLAFFGWVYLKRPARTDRHPVPYTIIGGLGLGITLAMSWRYGDAAGIVHIWSGLAVIAWFVYLRWYSPMRSQAGVSLAMGSPLPSFTLQDADGNEIGSETFLGNPHVLMFYRGNWCPFCTAQIKELAQRYREIETLGAPVILISPQPLEKIRRLAARFDVPMRFMRDPDNRAAKRLGIDEAWGVPMGMQALGYDSDSVRPTVIIINARGEILYSHLADNYRIRPEPEEFLKILGGAG